MTPAATAAVVCSLGDLAYTTREIVFDLMPHAAAEVRQPLLFILPCKVLGLIKQWLVYLTPPPPTN